MDTLTGHLPGSFEELGAQLAMDGVESSAAQVHGTICGLLAAQTEISTATWPRLLYGSTAVDPLSQPLANSIGELTDAERRALGSMDFDFALLLPRDTESHTVRAGALSDWCRGFLIGLLVDGRHSPEALPEDSREIVRDMIDIAGSDIDSDIDDDGSDEETEAALVEIEEYVRVGVQLVFEELRQAAEADAAQNQASSKNPPTVH